ncbi:MAG: flagellar biosynthesis protein FlhB [Phycisphaerae bacterium]|nr:flagellar biosynthesis protein FlhB [Phycisphaerae bacterium]
MADASSEKTEMPTGRRLTKAREAGKVPQSSELVSSVSLVALFATVYLLGSHLAQWMMASMRKALSCDRSVLDSSGLFLAHLHDKMAEAALIMAPYLLVLLVTGVGISIWISGWHVTFKPLEPKFNFFNPSAALGSMFSASTGVRILVSLAKLTIVSVIVYFYLRNRMEDIVALRWAWSTELVVGIMRLIFGALLRISIGLMIIGIADLLYQKWKYIEDLKMTKQEVKDEFRSMEGPPEIMRRIRQKQFEIALQRMMQEVPTANVVVVNPDHVAVALKYDPKTMGSPIVVAKGADKVCEKIKEIARAYGVPILRRPALARELFATVDLGRAIPEALFVAVAEILALVLRLRRNR